MTFELSKLVKFNEVKDEQPKNMPCIDLAFEVSKLDKSILVISLPAWNK